MLTDIEIAQQVKMLDIVKIAAKLNIREDELELYGKYKAKVLPKLWDRVKNNPNGKLILVTAINPTPAGEGKTTTTIGLGQAMSKIGKKTVIALREPSMGPVMGIKGGAAGGGYSQVVPMEDINLHFTGDMHAITSANNLLSAVIDNHIHQGNSLEIDPRQITWKRALDMNDRALRNVVVGLGGKVNGMPREDGFMITVASEIMAVLCLANNLTELKQKLSNIVIGYTYSNKPVKVKDLGIEGAMTVLLKDAIKPNLVQTLENTPCFMHGGPFANIAHGCNSLIATKLCLKLADYAITEAGFGADLGAEKFMNIKCRYGNIEPDAVVLVVSTRALKYNGGMPKSKLMNVNMEVLREGITNMDKHVENIKKFGVPVIVAINRFDSDTRDEIEFIRKHCFKLGVECELSQVYSKGGEGGINLAKKIVDVTQNNHSEFKFLYDTNLSIKDKINIIVTQIYGGNEVKYSTKAEKEIDNLQKLGYDKLPVCMAKTQYSLSDNATLLGKPENFTVNVKEVRVSAGAGFIVVLTGSILTMPGLPKNPAANDINIDADGKIKGLF